MVGADGAAELLLLTEWQAVEGGAKTGLVGLCRTLALELAPYQITVNTVTPGAVDGEGSIREMRK